MLTTQLKSRLKSWFGALALMTVPIVIVTPVAVAQGTVVAVYDQEQVMRESKAGKDIAAKLKSMSDSTKTQLKPEGDALENERKSLETRTASMSQEAIAADSALRGQVESYARKVQAYGQKVQRNGQELALTEREAWTSFFQGLEPVLEEVMNEKGASILLERGNAVLVKPNVDVTASVISKLDARLPSVSVVRKTLPAQPAAQ